MKLVSTKKWIRQVIVTVCVLAGLPVIAPAYAGTICISNCVDLVTVGGSPTLISNGSDGSLNVLTDTTLALAPDNRFDFSGVTLASGATLSFSGTNPAGVIYLLSQGDVSISGTLNAGQNSLVISTPGNLNITGNLQALPNISLISGGTSNFSGSATVGGITLSLSSDPGRISLQSAEVTLMQPGGNITLVQPGVIVPTRPQHNHDHSDDEDDAHHRSKAAERVEWRGKAEADTLRVKLLGINDFHGQLSAGRLVSSRPVGSAGVLASYLHAAQVGMEGKTVIVHAGDHVGATPPASALLQDEPAISFLNQLGNDRCRYPEREENESEYDNNKKSRHERNEHAERAGWHPKCNLVGTLGNHEFDEGVAEMRRLLNGGNHANGPFLENPWRGTRFPYVSANVVDAATGKPILPPYVIKNIDGIPIAFIGAVLKATPTIVTPSGVAGVKFLDEVEAINRYIPELRRKKVRAIVVLIHQGGRQNTYSGSTRPAAPAVTGDIVDIVNRLDDEVDVVVSGHWHSFTNAILNNQNGKPILVTQAFSSGTAYGDIDLEIGRASHDVVAKSAAIVTTWADEGPGLTPDNAAAQLTATAEERVAPLVNRVIGNAATDITRTENGAGESALGNLIADAQRAVLATDFAFMNSGGIRADIAAGEVTWGELFTVQPFGNSLVKMNLTGQQIYTLLEQQWVGQTFARILKTSGLRYTWNAAAPVGSRIVAVYRNGVPIDTGAVYSVTVNSFLSDGGDNFLVLREGVNRVGGAVDLDALIAYIQSLSQPFTSATEGRIQRLN